MPLRTRKSWSKSDKIQDFGNPEGTRVATPLRADLLPPRDLLELNTEKPSLKTRAFKVNVIGL